MLSCYKIYFILFIFVDCFLLEAQVKPELTIPIGHTNSVLSACFASDDKYVVTGGEDNIAILWEVATGKEIRRFKGHTSLVLSVCLSPDGKYLLTGSSDKTARLWDVATGKEIFIFKDHTGKVRSVKFSADGKWLLTGSSDKTILLWDASSGKVINTFIGHKDEVYAVGFSTDKKTIFSGSRDSTIRQWDITTGKEIKTFNTKNGAVYSVAISSDGKNLVSGGSDNTVHLWDIASGKEIKKFTGHTAAIRSVAISPDGKTILSGSVDKTAKLWDVFSRKEIKNITSHKKDVACVAFSSDGKLLLTGSFDMTAKLWSVNNNFKELKTLKGYAGFIYSVAISSDNRYILTGSNNRIAALWDLGTGKQIQTFKGHKNIIMGVAFTPNNNCAITCSYDKTIKLWDIATGKNIRTFIGHKDGVSTLACSPDGKQIASASDSTVKIWDLASGKEVLSFKGAHSWIVSIAYSPDGKTLALGSWDNSVKLFDALSGKEFMTFNGHMNWVNAVSFSHNGKMLASASNDKTVKVWDVITGKKLYDYNPGDQKVYAVAFSSDDKQIIVGSDGSAKVIDISTGKEKMTLAGHSAWVYSTAFSNDGKKILTGSWDGTAKLWDASSGKELCTLISLDSTDWVVTTSEGLFDASPGAMKMMYYVAGQESIELEQLKERYYEPGLLEKLVSINPEMPRNAKDFGVIKLYPDVKLSDENGSLDIQLKNRGGGIGKVVVYINGKEIEADARGATPDASADSLKLDVNIKDSPLLVSGASNVIEVKAYNAEGYLVSRGVQLIVAATNNIPAANPRLFAVCIGTSDYTGDAIDLKYAAKDADDMATALQTGAKRLFGEDKTFVYRLTTINKDAGLQPTKINIQKCFKEITAKAKSSDLIVVYISGHGINWGGQDGDFYYLTKDAYTGNIDAYNDPAIRASCTLSSAELTELIKQVPALKQVLIVDACSSGKIVDNLIAKRDISSSTLRALDRMKDRTGMHIITGCTADAVSYEASKFGQGLLTYSLIEGIKGSSLREGKFVDVAMLFQKARERVPELASGIGGIQKPEVFSPYGAESFDIGELNDQDKMSIPLAKEKPMFLMCSLQNSISFDDDLGMEKLVDEAFRSATSKGNISNIIFIEAKDFPDAYRIRGQYSLDGETVVLTANLFKGKEKAGSFNITGKKSEVEKLAEDLVKQAEALAK